MKFGKLGFLAVIALAGACDDDAFDDDDDDDDIDEAIDEGNGSANGSGSDTGSGSNAPLTFEWRATLQPTEVNGTLQGDALVRQTEGEDSFTAGITIRVDTPGALRPWHVHLGSCGEGGAIVGSDADYPRLGVGTDGTATNEVQVRVGLDPAAAYSVNVHCSDAELDHIIACGNLVMQ
jgi:hypothetical protein